tara:strand:+ start:331 stop:543 length:213 start_codon:yes stop_codon:yes gene_type:complete
MKALDRQVAGDHYKGLAIQPVEYCHRNGLGYCESSAIKYLTRWKNKNGIADLEKAKHFIELLIEFAEADG